MQVNRPITPTPNITTPPKTTTTKTKAVEVTTPNREPNRKIYPQPSEELATQRHLSNSDEMLAEIESQFSDPESIQGMDEVLSGVIQDNEDLPEPLREQLKTKSVGPEYRKVSPREPGYGLTETFEQSFIQDINAKETLFFDQEFSQTVNKLTFTDGRAKSTLLKTMERLERDIQALDTQLMDKKLNKNKRKALTEQRKLLLEKGQQLKKQYESYKNNLMQLQRMEALGVSEADLNSIKIQVKSSEVSLLEGLDNLKTDIHIDGNTALKKGAKLDNRMLFVMSPEGDFYTLDPTKRDIQLPDGTTVYQAKIHHSSMLNGQEISGAGELRVGSQLDDLAQDRMISKDGELMVDYSPEDFERVKNHIEANALKTVNRLFIDQFKTQQIEAIDKEKEALLHHDKMRHEDKLKKVKELDQKRQALVNNTFLKTSDNKTSEALRKQFQTYKAKQFSTFQRETLPKLLFLSLEQQFPQGKVEVLSDQSGHYQPDMSFTGQVIKTLEKQDVQIEALTVDLGSKLSVKTTVDGITTQYDEGSLRVPSSAVQSMSQNDELESDLREFDARKQGMHSELLSQVKKKNTEKIMDLESHLLTLKIQLQDPQTPDDKVQALGKQIKATQTEITRLRQANKSTESQKQTLESKRENFKQMSEAFLKKVNEGNVESTSKLVTAFTRYSLMNPEIGKLPENERDEAVMQAFKSFLAADAEIQAKEDTWNYMIEKMEMHLKKTQPEDESSDSGAYEYQSADSSPEQNTNSIENVEINAPRSPIQQPPRETTSGSDYEDHGF